MKNLPTHLASRALLACAYLGATGSVWASVGDRESHGLVVRISSILPTITEMAALFPIIGLIVAISATQLLRRRKIAQIRSGSSTGR